MDLLGRPLVVVLTVLAIGTPTATYLLWSRLRGPRAVRRRDHGWGCSG